MRRAFGYQPSAIGRRLQPQLAGYRSLTFLLRYEATQQGRTNTPRATTAQAATISSAV